MPFDLANANTSAFWQDVVGIFERNLDTFDPLHIGDGRRAENSTEAARRLMLSRQKLLEELLQLGTMSM